MEAKVQVRIPRSVQVELGVWALASSPLLQQLKFHFYIDESRRENDWNKNKCLEAV